MSLKVIMFGKLADIAGNTVLVNDVKDTDHLAEILTKTYPALSHSKFIIAVNRNVVKNNTALDSNSEVALLPPFSGG